MSFGGNVFTYGFDLRAMLGEVHRVLQDDGVFAFEQRPGDPGEPPWERILWFIDGGPPILHYGAGSGLHNRAYFIYLEPNSEQGRRLASLSQRMSAELSDEQRQVCRAISEEIETGALDIVDKVLYSGEGRSPGAEELWALLTAARFVDAVSWALPDSVKFARSLREDSVLSRLRQQDLKPCLRALVRSARTTPRWVYDWATCRKA